MISFYSFLLFNNSFCTQRVTEDGLLHLLSASPPGAFSVKALVSTQFNPALENATSELSVLVNWLPASGFINGILVRINKATSSWFVSQSNVSVVSYISHSTNTYSNISCKWCLLVLIANTKRTVFVRIGQ